MNRFIKIMARDCLIDKIQCPNPSCDTMLDVPNGKGKSGRVRREELRYKECGDSFRFQMVGPREEDQFKEQRRAAREAKGKKEPKQT